MHIVYVDDSKDAKHLCFSAIMLPADQWMQALDHLIGMRRAMNLSDGIYTSKELHATDWLGGRGKVAAYPVPKGTRVRLFDYALSAIAKIPSVSIFNAFGDHANETILFQRLIQRMHNKVHKRGSHAIIVSDNGKNYDGLLRRMRRFNPVPSAFGGWPTGSFTKDIPADRVLEDIVYRDSSKSHFIQAADFCAFSLLPYEAPTVKAVSYGYNRSFDILRPVLFTEAFKKDPRKLGIIRP